MTLSEIAALKGLGPKSASWLAEIGIDTVDQLRAVGAVRAYLLLEKHTAAKPSLNMLYALAGALDDKHWLKIVKQDKARLLNELDSARELERIVRCADD